MKRAMALLHPLLAPLGAFIIMAIHDELLVEAPIENAEAVKAIVKRVMCEAMMEFVPSIPIIVEAYIRPIWVEPEEPRV